MTSPVANPVSVIEWACAGAPIASERESGDLGVVIQFQDGALVAVIDGLGHGPEAALAARVAGTVLREHPRDRPTSLIERCHEALRKTRGGVMSIASIDAQNSTITWLGVGNVEGILLRHGESRSERIRLRGGIVGSQLPTCRSETLSIRSNDIVVLVTDGVRSNFLQALKIEDRPQVIADSIFARCARSSDDSTIVVARYVGKATTIVPLRED